MFHTNTNAQGSDEESNTLDPGLLTSRSSNRFSMASSSGRYGRLWRRSITVGILITIKKTSNDQGEDSLQSPTSSSPLLNHDTEQNSLQQEISDANSSVQENGFLSFVTKAYNSFSSTKSSKDQETSASCYDPVPSAASYDPVPSSPLNQGLVRNLSAQSQHTIDIQSDNEEEEKIEEQQLHNRVIQIVRKRDLTSLKNFGGVEKVASIFGSHLERGIDSIHDPQEWNIDNPNHEKGFFYYFLEAGNNYTIFLLLVSAGLSFTTEIMKEGPKYGWHDGAVILCAVSVLIIFTSVANYLRERKLKKKIWKEKKKLEVKVVRSRQSQLIPIPNLVPGDIVILEKGDRVPADGLVVSSAGLKLDGVLNSKVDCDENPFICCGSTVMEGKGNMLVILVGADTTLGKLSLVIQDPKKTTLLKAQIEQPNSYTENLSLFISVLIAIVALIRLLCGKKDEDDNGFPDLKGNVSVSMLMKIFEGILLKPQGRISISASVLTVVVISIQHGMPFVITAALSCWNHEVAKNQAEPQSLSACATMGIVTVMCIDATVGLVCGDLKVNKFLIGEKDLTDGDLEIDQAVLKALQRGIGVPLLAPTISASPTNYSPISWANSKWGGVNVEFLDQNLHVLGYRKLSSDSKCCGILMKHRDEEEKIMHMHWSGAASSILDMCSHYYDNNGRSHAIKDIKSRFELVIKNMEVSGLRPIAFACRQTEVQEIQEDGLHLLALAGLKYQCSEEIKVFIEDFRNAGVSIILVSEDELSAVRAIACELGLFSSDSNYLALECEQILDPSITKLDQVTLMGSCLAEDKLLLVQSVQQKGHVVAFFGGSSSSDTAALKEADVGITEATWCTQMARESSDIVIWAKRSLYPILKYGRCAYHNIQKFSQLQLTVCISGLLITLITTMISGESPITTLQLLWVNWITCILGGVMMTMELQVQELITTPPAEKTKSLLNKVMWKDIVIQVLSQASVLMIFQFRGQVIASMNQDVRKAMIYNSFALSQVFFLFYTMNLEKEALLSVLRNINFVLPLVTVIVIQVVVAEYLKSLADCVRLDWKQWGACFLLAALPCGIHVAVRFLSHSLLNRSFWSELSDSLQTVFSRRQPHPRPYLLCIGLPFAMFLLFTSSQ